MHKFLMKLEISEEFACSHLQKFNKKEVPQNRYLGRKWRNRQNLRVIESTKTNGQNNAQKLRLSIKDFSSYCDQMVTFAEGSLNRKLHFLMQ